MGECTAFFPDLKRKKKEKNKKKNPKRMLIFIAIKFERNSK